jgi:hypothetical protein
VIFILKTQKISYQVHIYEEKSEIYLVWLKCWIKIDIGNSKKNPTTYTCTCRFVSLFPVRQWTWVDKTVTSCQMYTLVSFTNKTDLHVIPDTLLKVSLNTNTTDRHIIRHSWNIVDSGVNTKKTASMLYVIPDTLLEVSLSTNKTGHHVLCYNWHIVESGVKHQ